jgi:uncharacterized membrane protein
VFITVGLIGVLFFASPAATLFAKAPVGQQFSVIYILGPNHTFDNIPFNIKAGVTYSVFLGVTSQMGFSNYYTCSVKLGSQNDSLPDSTLGTPSSLPTLYEYKTFLMDGATWEAPLTFQVNRLAFNNGTSQLSGITIDGIEFPVNETSAWSSDKKGYYYNLFAELWIFNSTLGISQYHDRFVDLILNMTQ